MSTTEAIGEYDLVALRDNIKHLGSRVGDRLIEHLVELSPSTGSDLGRSAGGLRCRARGTRDEALPPQIKLAGVENCNQRVQKMKQMLATGKVIS